MANITFYYLYRDAGNYKHFGNVVLENQGGVSLNDLDTAIKEALIDNEFFYPEAWGLPVLFFDGISFDTDPTWHEFERLAETADAAGGPFSVKALLDAIARAAADHPW